jgi:hypothetical protein
MTHQAVSRVNTLQINENVIEPLKLLENYEQFMDKGFRNSSFPLPLKYMLEMLRRNPKQTCLTCLTGNALNADWQKYLTSIFLFVL